MHQFKYYLVIWCACGIIGLLIDSVWGERLQLSNETELQSVRSRDRFQQQYQYAISKQPSKQQTNRGRLNGLSEIRKNLTQQGLWQRQGDDPDQDTKHSPIHEIQEKLKQSDRTREPLQENGSEQAEEETGERCSFETKCRWQWDETQNSTFQMVVGGNLTRTGARSEPNEKNKSNFLQLVLQPSTGVRSLKSPIFGITKEQCRLELFVHQRDNENGKFRIVIEPVSKHDTTAASSWVPIERNGNDLQDWTEYMFPIGRVSQEFRILLEIVPSEMKSPPLAHISLDNLRLRGCFEPNNQIAAVNGECGRSDVKCSVNKTIVCIQPRQHCDINIDCDNREDEMVNCEKIPFGALCDFENEWCGWQNSGKALMVWERHSGPTPTEKTGPDHDHTFQQYNSSGHYLFVNMNQHANSEDKKKLSGFASNAIINSVIFNPPPFAHLNSSSIYHHSCLVRFYVHQLGKNAGSLNLSVVEIKERENITSTLWWSSREIGFDWVRIQIPMPNITSRYYLQFEARMGMRIYSDVAIDDFSLTPECFGLNMPPEHLQGYNYYDQRILQDKSAHEDFANQTNLQLSNCNSRGRDGPTALDCAETYNNTDAESIHVIENQMYKGIQVWNVPNENYYTIIAKGAGGGLGNRGGGSTRGALVISVLELHRDEKIYILIGQQGENACIKSIMNPSDNCGLRNKRTNGRTTGAKNKQSKDILTNDMTGGGGGGATFIFTFRNSAESPVPLLIAGGGGGLGMGRFNEDTQQHGKAYDKSCTEMSGQRQDEMNTTGGAGGGWRPNDNNEFDPYSGVSLLEGARGGESCYASKEVGIHGQGGFGGGGGGCQTGGAGGGYTGGNAFSTRKNGEGGMSFIGSRRSHPELSFIYAGDNSGHGSVVIVPALPNPACGCDYRCVVLDEFSANVKCICPEGWKLKKDNQTACEPMFRNEIPMEYLIIFFAVITLLLIAALGALIFILYNRYQRKRQLALRHKVFLEQDLQLSRLRNNLEEQVQTNFNPNYGPEVTVNTVGDMKAVPQINREKLSMFKALGQGAFGEVFQGTYKYKDSDMVEMPVAIKTLPEMSTCQAEADFQMEAAIMAKFRHPNIVHLIGVCFERHPRFIVLELLAGGDLKNFLREGRHKAERPSPLIIRDLVYCAIDVARGCRYMETKRFIHRDIAARNCLLTTKGPGRVVKIADFGMARDIYRSDYYRKGGKAMLPIKWMPPEAFLDGIFTSKTDVWSFGVLLWEIFSMGMMPYTGLPNRTVMELVTGGGRLDCPNECPGFIFSLMSDCWHSVPEERPKFDVLLHKLLAIQRNEEVMKEPIPQFFTEPPEMREIPLLLPKRDGFRITHNNSDYMIPLPDSRMFVQQILNNSIGVTMPDHMLNYAHDLELGTMSSADSISTIAPPTSFGDVSPVIPFDMRSTAHERNSVSPNHQFTADASFSSDKLIVLDGKQQNESSHKSKKAQLPNGLDGNGNGRANDDHKDVKSKQKSPIDKCKTNNNNHAKAGSSTGPITLDPSKLDSYASVQITGAQQETSFTGKSTNIPGNNNENLNAPFTIQDHSEQYTGSIRTLSPIPIPASVSDMNCTRESHVGCHFQHRSSACTLSIKAANISQRSATGGVRGCSEYVIKYALPKDRR